MLYGRFTVWIKRGDKFQRNKCFIFICGEQYNCTTSTADFYLSDMEFSVQRYVKEVLLFLISTW